MAKKTKLSATDLILSEQLRAELAPLLDAGYRPRTHIGHSENGVGFVCSIIFFSKVVKVRGPFEISCEIQYSPSRYKNIPSFTILIDGNGEDRQVTAYTGAQALEAAETELRDAVSAARSRIATLIREAEAKYRAETAGFWTYP